MDCARFAAALALSFAAQSSTHGGTTVYYLTTVDDHGQPAVLEGTRQELEELAAVLRALDPPRPFRIGRRHIEADEPWLLPIGFAER
jgi:hypothetical protein